MIVFASKKPPEGSGVDVKFNPVVVATGSFTPPPASPGDREDKKD